ncbi:MAG TPA: hypothetical protein VIJ79_15340 [Acidobacteriaceae bacterium]
MSDIEQITGREHERAITLASKPYVAWLDGTAETGRTSFVEFAAVVERSAIPLRLKARVVLVNVEVWDGTSARFAVIGSPQLVIFKGGKKIVHQIGTAALPGLLPWANPHLAGSTIAVSWSDCVWQSAIGR